MNESCHNIDSLPDPVRTLEGRVVELQQALHELHRCEQELRSIAENVPDIMTRFDRDFRHIYINRQITAHTGLSVETFLGKTDRELGMPEDLVNRWEEKLAGVFARGQPDTLEFVLPTPAGRLYFESRLLPERGDDGAVRTVLGITRNVTDREQAQQALADEHQRLLAFFDNSLDAILLFNDEGRFVDANPAACALLGYSRQELLQLHALDVTAEVDRPRFPELWQRFRAEGSHGGDYAMRCKDGSVRATEYRAVANFQPGLHLSVSRDVSERRRIEEELRRSRQYLQTIIDTTPECVKIVAADGTLLAMNSAGLAMLEAQTAEEVVGRSAYDLIAPEDRERYRAFNEAVCAGARRQLAFVMIGLRGRRRQLETHAAPLPWPDGRRVCVGSTRDVTEQRRLEEQLRQALKMEAIGRLAGGVAHDFNNLLTVITGYSDILLGSADLGAPVRGPIQEIRKAATRAAELTAQLLAFGRRTLTAPVDLDINAVVLEAEKMLCRLIGEHIELSLELAPDLGSVKIDPGQLHQVIVNLAVNARDAMLRGGRLTIATRNVELDENFVRGQCELQPGRYVALVVRDSGVGIADDIKKHLFEPFFTTKEFGKGTGLGLATVYGIVKGNGGHIEIDSAPGAGATFTVYLPRVERIKARDVQTVPSTLPHGNETILLVEDDEMVRAFTGLALRDLGYDVLEAADPMKALALSDAHPGDIQLLVTDVVMPHLSGRALADRLTQRRPSMKVLFVSGYTDEAVLHHGGADMLFIQKPYTSSALATKVRGVLDAAPAR
jgi:two-component system cell cycle sensor histidine kinase/response regulator CckA